MATTGVWRTRSSCLPTVPAQPVQRFPNPQVRVRPLVIEALRVCARVCVCIDMRIDMRVHTLRTELRVVVAEVKKAPVKRAPDTAARCTRLTCKGTRSLAASHSVCCTSLSRWTVWRMLHLALVARTSSAEAHGLCAALGSGHVGSGGGVVCIRVRMCVKVKVCVRERVRVCPCSSGKSRVRAR